MNQSEYIDKFNTKSPINESILNIIGYYLIVCCFLCLLLNSILLLVFIRCKELRIPLNLFIITPITHIITIKLNGSNNKNHIKTFSIL